MPPPTRDPLPKSAFDRVDERADSLFYDVPRLVVHIDAATIQSLTAYYGELLFSGADVLDLMSSWVSHLPSGVPLGRVAGLGMNAAELEANPVLTERVVHDLNESPRLPYPDAAFDFVLNAVSVQYLKQPFEVFAEIARVLRPGGRSIVAMSHRCFPTKAIRAFHVPGSAERFRLVESYHEACGGFGETRSLDRSPSGADPLWIVVATRAA